MPNESHQELNEELVRDRLCHVTGNKTETAWVLLQEPGFIGFGVVRQDKIFWPPYPYRPKDWGRVSDLRLFGEKGEWHVWPHWNGGWKSRLLKLENLKDALTEYHALWGTKVESSDTPPWIKLTEDRGTEIWLPLQGQVKDNEKDGEPLLRLKLKQVIDYDPKYHLAGIVDAALVGLVPKASEDLLFPDDSLLCS